MSELILFIGLLSQECKTHRSPNNLVLLFCVTFYFQKFSKYFLFTTYYENVNKLRENHSKEGVSSKGHV